MATVYTQGIFVIAQGASYLRDGVPHTAVKPLVLRGTTKVYRNPKPENLILIEGESLTNPTKARYAVLRPWVKGYNQNKKFHTCPHCRGKGKWLDGSECYPCTGAGMLNEEALKNHIRVLAKWRARGKEWALTEWNEIAASELASYLPAEASATK